MIAVHQLMCRVVLGALSPAEQALAWRHFAVCLQISLLPVSPVRCLSPCMRWPLVPV